MTLHAWNVVVRKSRCDLQRTANAGLVAGMEGCAAEGHEGSEALADEIKTFVRDRLSAYAYPRRIELREREREAAAP